MSLATGCFPVEDHTDGCEDISDWESADEGIDQNATSPDDDVSVNMLSLGELIDVEDKKKMCTTT